LPGEGEKNGRGYQKIAPAIRFYTHLPLLTLLRAQTAYQWVNTFRTL
jgi:hypothetical protein